MPVAHLHVHTQYTLLASSGRSDQYAARAAANGVVALAITDPNGHGWVEHWKACKAAGVQPIIGAEFGDHRIALVESIEGYRNLCARISGQESSDEGLIWVGEDVAKWPVYYCEPADAELQPYLHAIRTKRRVSDIVQCYHGRSDLYLLSDSEMRARFSASACDATLEIAERCSKFQLPLGKPRLPEFGSVAMLREDAQAGLVRRGLSELPAYRDRLSFEIGVIERMGFAGYFLIVADFIREARARDIPVGPGRGSGVGSLAAYCLGITDLDPIEHGLLFERFLNPDRVSPPDFDIDFCMLRRDEVIEYVRAKYGAENVGRIAAISTFHAKGVIRDLMRTLCAPPAVAGQLAGLVADKGRGLTYTIKEAAEVEPRLKERWVSGTRDGLCLTLADRIEGLARHIGAHAAGVVIAPEPLARAVPCTRDGDELVSQLDMTDLESIGLIKFDFLGLKTLTVIDAATKATGLDWGRVQLTDKKTYDLLGEGRTVGVFQLETFGMQQLLRKLRPECFEEITAVVALYRPGPLDSGMAEDFCARKHGKQAIASFHPLADACLANTYGVPVYQEQVMQIAQLLSGYSLAEADLLRRAMGKKKPEEMAAQKARFLSGAAANGVAESTAAEIFSVLEGFASYGFNKCIAGDTVVQLGAANAHTDGKVTLRYLYERYNTVGRGSCGACLWCKKKPARKVGLCSGCAAWRAKFRRGKISVLALDDDGRIRPKPIKAVYKNEPKELWRITLANGRHIDATLDHRHMTPEGWREVRELRVGDMLVTHEGVDAKSAMSLESMRTTRGKRSGSGKVNGAYGATNCGYIDGGFALLSRWTKSAPNHCEHCMASEVRLERAHLDGNRTNNSAENLKMLCVSCHKRHDYAHNNRVRRFGKGHLAGTSAITAIECIGVDETFDLEIDDPRHCYVANGIVTHNSHAAAYAMICYRTAYLKAHYPAEFFAASLNAAIGDVDEISRLVADARACGVAIVPPSLERSKPEFAVHDGAVVWGLSGIKGMGKAAVTRKFGKRATEALKASGCTDRSDWSRTERLSQERRVLGVYLTDHPMHGERVPHYCVQSISALSVKDERISLCGVIFALNENTSVDGERWATAELEDLSGRVQLKFYHDVLKQSEDLIRSAEPLILSGKLKRRSESDAPTMAVYSVKRLRSGK